MMLSPKTVIPPLVLAVLPLTGIGCGSSSGTPSEQVISGFRAFCMKLAECYPDDTAETVDECAQYYGNYYSNVAEGCQLAIASYFECLGGLTCAEYANDDEQCYDAAVDALNRECGLSDNSN
jgi:hypothetical protein